MKELLAALEKFSSNPEAIGDNLFSFFAVISKMTWEDAVAAGCAIAALKSDAFNKADVVAKAKGKEHEFDALKDPTFTRLESCLAPVIGRLGQLLAEAPKEKQPMLLQSISGGQVAILKFQTRDDWRKTLGIEVKK